MRLILLPAIWIFIACKPSPNSGRRFEKIVPDSVGSYYAEQFHKTYLTTRRVANRFMVEDISNGTNNEQIWFWNISSSYDPQTIYILENNYSDIWNLRVIKYYASQRDSITSDVRKKVKKSHFDALHLDRFWKLPSQSQLRNGDKYGCVDGNIVLIEMANSVRYKYILFRCPDMHADKDTAFYLVNEFSKSLLQSDLANR